MSFGNEENSTKISERKKEHLILGSSDNAAFKIKTNGFENYEFKHYAITEVDINKIDFSKDFFGKKINYPFLISSMTGGTEESNNINLKLAEVAQSLNIPLALGSMRYALDSDEYDNHLKEIKRKSLSIPLIGNIGASQLIKEKKISRLQRLIDKIDADAFIVHINSVQEYLQKEGEPYFVNLLKSLENLVKKLSIPIIVKEVGAGISSEVATKLLNVGVKGIDIAGAGGTSWAGIELIRNNRKDHSDEIEVEEKEKFWDWGLPTSYCIRTVSKLKKKYNFMLIGSGGINDSFELAKALALGADVAASARIILQKLNKNGVDGVINFIFNWFENLKGIMFLTGSQKLKDLNDKKLIHKRELY